MVELVMPSEFVKEFLKLFDFLTVVDRERIVKGLAYVRSKAKKIKGYKENKEEAEKLFDILCLPVG
jgi:hypothetical protein